MNEHGLDRGENRVGAYGSAKDMVVLFEYILKNYPDLLEATKYSHLTFQDESGALYTANNTNVASDLIPSLIASKTGYTDLAGGNLVVAFDAGLNHPVIVSVLGSTRDDRFADTLTLVNATMKYIKDN
jgi:D-alanyl-D-alanine carboxypeptidase (penicillin-binding protein 5/6)